MNDVKSIQREFLIKDETARQQISTVNARLTQEVQLITQQMGSIEEDITNNNDSVTRTLAGIQANLSELMMKFTTRTLLSGNVRAVQNGDIVNIDVYYPTSEAPTLTAKTWNLLATLPEGSRPSRTKYFICYDNSVASDADNTIIDGRISTNGKIEIYSFSKTSIPPVGSISFIINS